MLQWNRRFAALLAVLALVASFFGLGGIDGSWFGWGW